jgi:predicted metal-binding protein
MMYRKSVTYLKDRALELGARDAKVIDAKSVKTAAWVRFKCQFGCSGFGESLTCPPYSPTPEQTRKILDCYTRAILAHRSGTDAVNMTTLVLELEKEAFLAGYYKALAMGSGPCMLCAVCNLKGTCRHGDDARPSMEACGIDVYATARGNGFAIETLDSPKCKGNYFGLVLLK